MTRILWCGGSHLANTSGAVRHWHEVQGLPEADFYMSAGPKNATWSMRGGRYRVTGSVVEGRRSNPVPALDLAPYDIIAFVGQWIHPHWLTMGPFDWGQPISPALLRATLRDQFLYPARELEGRIKRYYNEPLALFPKLTEARCVLLPDPAPRSESYLSAPAWLRTAFFEELAAWAPEQGLHVDLQRENTLAADGGTSLEFQRDPEDYTHMTRAFWDIRLAEATPVILGS